MSVRGGGARRFSTGARCAGQQFPHYRRCETPSQAATDFMLRFCDNGQDHANRGAASELAFRFDPAAVQLGDMFHNREPEAGAAELRAAGLVRAIKSFKNSRQMFLTNSDAIVAYAKHYFAPTTLRSEMNLAVLTRIFDCVIEQIIENLT